MHNVDAAMEVRIGRQTYLADLAQPHMLAGRVVSSRRKPWKAAN